MGLDELGNILLHSETTSETFPDQITHCIISEDNGGNVEINYLLMRRYLMMTVVIGPGPFITRVEQE